MCALVFGGGQGGRGRKDCVCQREAHRFSQQQKKGNSFLIKITFLSFKTQRRRERKRESEERERARESERERERDRER